MAKKDKADNAAVGTEPKKKKKSRHILLKLILIVLLVGIVYFGNFYMRAKTICNAIEQDAFTVTVEADRTQKAPGWMGKIVSFLRKGEEVDLNHYRIEGGYSHGTMEGTLMIGTQNVVLTDFMIRDDVSLVDIGGIYNRVRSYTIGDNALLDKMIPEWGIVPYVPMNTLGKLMSNSKIKDSDMVSKIETMRGSVTQGPVFLLLMSADEKSFLGNKYVYHITADDKRIARLEKLAGASLELNPETDIQMTVAIKKKGVVAIDVACKRLPNGEYENMALHLELTPYEVKETNPGYVKEEDSEKFFELFEMIKSFFL